MNVPLGDSTHDGRAFFLCFLSKERTVPTTGRMLKTLLACESEESAILTGGRRIPAVHMGGGDIASGFEGSFTREFRDRSFSPN
jgi:hypothetical protein